MRKPVPAPRPFKRIVLEHAKGALKGFFQILGSTNKSTSQLPAFMELTFPDHPGAASLIRETPRAVYYRELVTPNEANAAHDEFHKEQQ